MDVVLQIGSALSQAVSRQSVNGPCGIRGAQSGSKIGVAVYLLRFPLSVAHHQCSILICTLKADSHTACRSHAAPYAVPLPCRAAKGLECIFPI